MRSRNAQHVSLPRRHPLEVTAGRLTLHRERYFHRLTPAERDALEVARHALERLVAGDQEG